MEFASKTDPLAERLRIGLKSSPMKESTAPLPADIAALSFEDALLELEKLVKQLEDGRAKLDDAIKAYERGALLKRHCETKLRQAQAKIEQITLGADGSVSTKPFNA
jgi:exodeoxyribonuclease VII small subunit